jgi:hypothetical protein
MKYSLCEFSLVGQFEFLGSSEVVFEQWLLEGLH